MSNPKFSVIIPAYNAEATLRSTVASVLKQSEPDFEVIIVDDGSTDGTLLAMLELSCIDLRVRAVSRPNSGVSATRNYGASLARGEILAFLDADDQWYPNKLRQHRELHETETLVQVSYAKVAFCADSDGALRAGPSVSSFPTEATQAVHSVSDVVIENPACTTSNLVISRKAFDTSGGFKESLRYAEDQEFLARLVSSGANVRAIDQTLVKYRMSEDGLSCDLEAMLSGWLTFAGEWLGRDELAQAEATYCRYLARRALRAGASMTSARAYVRRGLAANRATFMSARSRSLLTICGAYAGGMLPSSMRRAVFA